MNNECMIPEMVSIPAGHYVMGSALGAGEPDEYPPHQVWLPSFQIGRCLVTATEWALFLNDLGEAKALDLFEPGPETTVTWRDGHFEVRQDCLEHPANGISWLAAIGYCRWLSLKTGRLYRLPLEAEWEKASRGGRTNTYYPWGSENPLGRANFGRSFAAPRLTITPVTAYPPNAYGIYDAVGNLAQWCQDFYQPQYYANSPEVRPPGPAEGRLRVLRGGSWGGLDIQIRCGSRSGEFPDIGESRLGLRLAHTPQTVVSARPPDSLGAA